MQRRTFLSSLASLALLAACGRKASLPALPAGSVVLAFGDSVTYGTGADPGEDWPTLLAALTGWQVINAGIPGDTAEAAKGRIQSLLDQHHPELVIVELGGNDFLRRRPQAAVKEDLRRIVDTIGQSGAQAVLVAVPELSLLAALANRPSDAPLYRELADEMDLPLVPDVFAEILGTPELCADRIHPNARGYARMATGIHTRLQELGLAAGGG